LTVRVVQRVAARSDLRRIVEWIADDNPGAARRLVQAYARLLRQISEFPASGRRYSLQLPHRHDIRFVPLPKFANYLVFYRVHDDRVEILRFLHSARDIEAMIWDDFGIGADGQ
jgi:toxin ParE1/3/4